MRAMSDPATPFACRVAFPLGSVVVRVDRRDLGLGDRGGFDAHWDDTPGDVQGGAPLTLEAFRLRLRSHLQAIERCERGREAPKVALNLASHQLLDDVGGWCRLNVR
jgi:hypothetical protein